MDKQNRNLLVAGAVGLGLLAYSLFRKGRTLKNLNFAIKGIDLDIPKKTASVELRIINPTKDQITLNSIVCDLIVNDEAIGTVKFLKDQVITGQSEIVVKMPLAVNTIALVSLGITVLTSKLTELKMKVKGTASAENILFPIDVNYTYKLPTQNKK
jgi:LEA14-like dessication related protein